MLKTFASFLAVGLLSLTLATAVQAQPGDDGAATTSTSARAADDDEMEFPWGAIGLLGLLGLAGLMPRKNHDNHRRDNVGTTNRT